MENFFETLAAITKPSKYFVNTENRGMLTFDQLPKGTYFMEGSSDMKDKGKAMYYTFDNCGTCLIPIKDENGNDIYIPDMSGKTL